MPCTLLRKEGSVDELRQLVLVHRSPVPHVDSDVDLRSPLVGVAIFVEVVYVSVEQYGSLVAETELLEPVTDRAVRLARAGGDPDGGQVLL